MQSTTPSMQSRTKSQRYNTPWKTTPTPHTTTIPTTWLYLGVKKCPQTITNIQTLSHKLQLQLQLKLPNWSIKMHPNHDLYEPRHLYDPMTPTTPWPSIHTHITTPQIPHPAKKRSSATGNRTRISVVTGRNTNHYTITDWVLIVVVDYWSLLRLSIKWCPLWESNSIPSTY